MQHKRFLAGTAASSLLIFTTALVASAWPLPYHGQPLRTRDGVLIAFGNGNKAGGLTIRTKSGTKQDFATSRLTTFDHRHIACFTMPSPAMKCADWPMQIVPHKTVVRVTYWSGDTGSPGPGGPGRIVKDVSPK